MRTNRSPRLRFDGTIPRQEAEEMLHAFVACGENSGRTWFWSSLQVKSFFGDRYDDLVASAQRGEPIPHFENLLRGTFQVVAPDSYLVLRLSPSGEEIQIPEAGVINTSQYVSKFEAAVDARDRAVKQKSTTEFETVAFLGVSAIEAYFNWQAEAWDHFHPDNRMPRTRRMSLDQKIKVWLPLLATGSSLDYTHISWDRFFELKQLRNRSTHPRQGGSGITLKELARRLNLFRTAIAAPLMQLHQVFHERIPSVVIRAAYAPDVIVVDGAEETA
jgi:hypothetical protein